MNSKIVALFVISLFLTSGIITVSAKNLETTSLSTNEEKIELDIAYLVTWLYPSRDEGGGYGLVINCEIKNIGEEVNEEGILYWRCVGIFPDYEKIFFTADQQDWARWGKNKILLGIYGVFYSFNEKEELPSEIRIETWASDNIPQIKSDNNDETSICYASVAVSGNLYEKDKNGVLHSLESTNVAVSFCNSDIEDKDYVTTYGRGACSISTKDGTYRVCAPKHPNKRPFSYTIKVNYKDEEGETREKTFQTPRMESFSSIELDLTIVTKSRSVSLFEKYLDNFPFFTRLLSFFIKV